MQAMCPAGYHIPTQREWCDTITTLNPGVSCTGSWQNDSTVLPTLKLPMAGYRQATT